MNTVTLNMILDLPKQILEKSEEYDAYSSLLREKVYEDFDMKELKQKILELFEYFNDMRYLYKCPIEQRIKITPSYTENVGKSIGNVSDKVNNLVTKKVDQQIWVEDFYLCIINLSSKLTLQEATYLVDTFFGRKSEDMISEKLGICRNTLQKIKKSCLVKIWFEFQEFIEDGE